MTDTSEVTRPRGKNIRLHWFHTSPLSAPLRCQMAAIWNDLELDVHMQSTLHFTNTNDAFGVARPIGSKISFWRCHISPLPAPARCQMAAIWNLKELDAHMQPETIIDTLYDVFGVALPEITKTCLCSCHISPLSAPRRCQMAAIWNDLELDVHMQSTLHFTNADDAFGVARPIGSKTSFWRCHISPLPALARCQMAAIWNLKELDVHTQP
jgi:hypothetical protein